MIFEWPPGDNACTKMSKLCTLIKPTPYDTVQNMFQSNSHVFKVAFYNQLPLSFCEKKLLYVSNEAVLFRITEVR